MTFYLSKLLWMLFNPFNLIILLFFSSLIFSFLRLKIISRIFYIFAIFLFFVTGFLPTGSYLNYLLEKKYHSFDMYSLNIDGILVLSGATDPKLSEEYNQVILNESAERLTQTVFLLNKYPNAKIVFSGGSSLIEFSDLNHSNIAKKFFENMNVNSTNIYYETKSRNTFENILLSKKIAKPDKNESWLIVTSAFHMHRALAIAKHLDWNFIPYPTDFRQSKKFKWKISFNILSNLNDFEKSSHEWIGLISYYLLGRSSYIF